jgi:hypothetical protein
MEFANHAETKAIQTLPFTVEIATRQDLDDVANLRASAYGKHLPALGLKLLEPEMADYEPGCEVFIARSRLDGTLLGTLRTHANVLEKLPLQASMRLPTHMLGTRMVETTRLCVKSGGKCFSCSHNIVQSALPLLPEPEGGLDDGCRSPTCRPDIRQSLVH